MPNWFAWREDTEGAPWGPGDHRERCAGKDFGAMGTIELPAVQKRLAEVDSLLQAQGPCSGLSS